MNPRWEREVVDGLRRGCATSWQRLYDAYAPAVWRAVARRVEGDPADLVQEIFVEAARTARSFDQARGTLRMWLYGIVRHRIAFDRRVRERDRRHRPALAERAGSASRPAERPERGTMSREDASRLRTALRTLPGEYERLLTAKYVHGWSMERLARRSNSTPEAIKSKLARARAALRTALGGEDGP